MKKEQTIANTREDRILKRMTERVRNSRTLEDRYEATLDPRQFQPKEKEDGRS